MKEVCLNEKYFFTVIFLFLINITSVVYSDNIINNSDHQYNQQLEFQEKLRLGNNSNVNLYDKYKS